MKKPKVGRPPVGRSARVELRLEPALDKLVRDSAEKSDVSVNDWFISAALLKLSASAPTSPRVRPVAQVRLGEPDDEVTRGK